MDIGALRYEDEKGKRLVGLCIVDGCTNASAVGSDWCNLGDEQAHEADWAAQAQLDEYIAWEDARFGLF